MRQLSLSSRLRQNNHIGFTSEVVVFSSHIPIINYEDLSSTYNFKVRGRDPAIKNATQMKPLPLYIHRELFIFLLLIRKVLYFVFFFNLCSVCLLKLTEYSPRRSFIVILFKLIC